MKKSSGNLDALSKLLNIKQDNEALNISNLGEIQKELVTLRQEFTKINKQRDLINKKINKLVITRRNIQNKERRLLKSTLPSKASEAEYTVKFKKPVKRKKK